LQLPLTAEKSISLTKHKVKWHHKISIKLSPCCMAVYCKQILMLQTM